MDEANWYKPWEELDVWVDYINAWQGHLGIALA